MSSTPWDTVIPSVAFERNSKLVVTFHLGRRDKPSTEAFIEKLRRATSEKRFQISTDGFGPYIYAMDYALIDRCDYAQLVKVYQAPREGEQKYSPPDVVKAVPTPVMGNPDPERICTSHVERQNLTMRMQIRRLTRLTNAFSKKWLNLKAALALYFAWYNFSRVHRTIRMTPAILFGPFRTTKNEAAMSIAGEKSGLAQGQAEGALVCATHNILKLYRLCYG